jgi:hypothetical protein
MPKAKADSPAIAREAARKNAAILFADSQTEIASEIEHPDAAFLKQHPF